MAVTAGSGPHHRAESHKPPWTPSNAPKTGPGPPQKRSFCGERRRKGVERSFRRKAETKWCGLCADEESRTVSFSAEKEMVFAPGGKPPPAGWCPASPGGRRPLLQMARRGRRAPRGKHGIHRNGASGKPRPTEGTHPTQKGPRPAEGRHNPTQKGPHPTQKGPCPAQEGQKRGAFAPLSSPE